MFTENRPDRPVQGVVFDAVGTLIMPDPPVAEAYAEAARRQGILLASSQIHERFGQSFETDELDELRGPMATDEDNERRRWQRIVATCLPEVPDASRAFTELWDYFQRPEAWRVAPEAGPTLEALEKRGLALRIASNFDARLRRVLDGLEPLARLSDSALISSEVGYRKPHPKFYQAVCASLGLPPASLLFVGDDLENDWQGPRRSGLQAILLDPKRRAPDDVATIQRLDELIPWLSLEP